MSDMNTVNTGAAAPQDERALFQIPEILPEDLDAGDAFLSEIPAMGRYECSANPKIGYIRTVLRSALGRAALPAQAVATVADEPVGEIEWDIRDDDIHPPRPFWHARIYYQGFSTEWRKVGRQEVKDVPKDLKDATEAELRAELRTMLALAAPVQDVAPSENDALRCAVGNCTFNGQVAQHSPTCPHSAVAKDVAPSDAREQGRREQAEAVMPLIGPLLDAWDGANHDDRAAMTECGLGTHIIAIYRAMTEDQPAARAAQPAAQPSGNPGEFAAQLSGNPGQLAAQPADALAREVEIMVSMIEEKEWAEHVGKTPLGQRLEAAITQLHSDIHDAAEDPPADVQDAARYRWLCDKLGVTKLPCAIERIIEGGYIADGKPSIDAAIDAAMARTPEGAAS